MHHTQLDRELSLPEVLADPIVQAVMASDRITPEEMEGLIGTIRGRLAGRVVPAPGAIAPVEG